VTISRADTSPSGWYRYKVTNDLLGVIVRYLEKHQVNAQISGAVTCGVMESLFGPAQCTVAFEDEQAYTTFKQFMIDSPQPTDDFIVIPLEKYLAVPGVGGGSRVEVLPK
jgi:hypothetical protein